MSPAKALLEDLSCRIEHADAVVVYVRTKAGNHVLMESSNVTEEHLKAAQTQIEHSIEQRISSW